MRQGEKLPSENDSPILGWVVPFSGFLQRNGDYHGIVQTWHCLYRSFGSDRLKIMVPRPWNADVEQIAEMIHRCRNGEKPEIITIGYSWGGMAAVNFSKELAKRELHVRRMILTDPVHRHKWFYGRWRAFLPEVKIHIPDNVRNFTGFRQKRDWPTGHDLKFSPKTQARTYDTIPYDHATMDDAYEFQQACVHHVRDLHDEIEEKR